MRRKKKEPAKIKMINKVVGKNLKKYRKVAGLTQESIAEKTNLTIEYLSKLENGAYNARVSTIIDICKAISITPTLLLADFFSDNSNGLSEIIFEEVDKLSLEDQKLALAIIKRLSKNSFNLLYIKKDTMNITIIHGIFYIILLIFLLHL